MFEVPHHLQNLATAFASMPAELHQQFQNAYRNEPFWQAVLRGIADNSPTTLQTLPPIDNNHLQCTTTSSDG